MPALKAMSQVTVIGVGKADSGINSPAVVLRLPESSPSAEVLYTVEPSAIEAAHNNPKKIRTNIPPVDVLTIPGSGSCENRESTEAAFLTLLGGEGDGRSTAAG